MESTYRWMDWFTKQRLHCRCEVLNRTRTTATIKLREYGPRGRVPGTVMNVKITSVDCFKKEAKPVQTELNWHDWTDK